jgi:tetratricopeptide (TPR) repeat protein
LTSPGQTIAVGQTASSEDGETIRSLRMRLARALSIAHPESDEPVNQLQLALQERLEAFPPDNQIYYELGKVLQGRRSAAAAFQAFVAAVAAGPGSGVPAAEAALALLDRNSLTLANTLSPTEIQAALAAVCECHTPPTLAECLLVARLSRGSGDLDGAIRSFRVLADAAGPAEAIVFTELAAVLIDAGRPEEALKYLDRVPAPAGEEVSTLRGWAMLDSGRFEDALAASYEASTAGAPHRVSAALALFGLGQNEQALELIGAASAVDQPSRDAALAEAVIRLHIASLGGPEVDGDAVAAANEAALVAARLEPSNYEVLLVRAQVQLEGVVQVEEARRLLQSAVERVGPAIEQSRWLRIQDRARAHNGWFQYFRTELAAARRDFVQVLQRGQSVDRSSTPFAQDAALDMLLAEAHQQRGEHASAEQLFASAARYYSNANDLTAALVASRKRLASRPSAEAACDLADYAWRLTYTSLSKEQLDKHIAEGLRALESIEDDVPDGLLGEVTVQRGLLLSRAADLAGSRVIGDNWSPIPWLLIAWLLKPTEGFWAAHVAWAFDTVDAQRAALYFSERAYEQNNTDPYPQQTLIAMRFNYFAHLDADTEELAREFQDDAAWRDSVLLQSAMADGNLAAWEGVSWDKLLDVPWMRDSFARVCVLTRGVEAARPYLLQVLEEAQQRPRRWSAAVDISLLLGDPAGATQLIRTGESSGEVTQDEARYKLAMIALATSGGQDAVDSIAEHLRTRRHANDLRWALSVELPGMRYVPNRAPGVDDALEALVTIARERMRALESQPLPPLALEVPAACRAEHCDLILPLVELEQFRHAEEWQPAAETARRLGGRVEGLLGSALRKLASDYQAKVS